MPDVVINFASAGEANVVRAWAAQAAAAKAHNATLGEAYNAAMRTDSSLKQLTSAGTKGMRSLGGEIKSFTLGILGGGGVIGALTMWKSANDDILKQAHDTTLVYDSLFRKFNIQSGLRGLAGKEAKEKLLDVASQRAVPEEVAAQAATQLVSSGYDVKEVVQGGAANEFLQGMNAMNQRGAGVDATSLAGAATSFMTAMGVNKDAAGMRGTMSSLFSAFQGTNIQLPDLQQYAAKAGGMKGKLSFQELIAAGSIHRDIGMPGAESATGLATVVSRLGTAGASKEKTDVLKSIGLAPEDIDLIGENFDTVLGRIGDRLQSIPEAKRDDVLAKLFGDEGVKAVTPLLSGRDAMTSRIAAMQDAEGSYAGAVAEAEQGPNAVKTRQDLARNRRREHQNRNQVEVLNELIAMAEESDESPARVELAKKAFEGSMGITGDLDTAGRAFTNISGLEFSDYSKTKKRLSEKGLNFGSFGDKGDSPITAEERRADLEKKKTAAESDRDSGQRFSFSWNREAEKQAAQKQVAMYERMIAALDANTAATRGNTTANGGVETPPAAPPSVGVAR